MHVEILSAQEKDIIVMCLRITVLPLCMKVTKYPRKEGIIISWKESCVNKKDYGVLFRSDLCKLARFSCLGYQQICCPGDMRPPTATVADSLRILLKGSLIFSKTTEKQLLTLSPLS